MEDVQRLGLEIALKIAAIRNSLVFEPSSNEDEAVQSVWSVPSFSSSSRPSANITSVTRNASDVDFTPAIKKVFKSALKVAVPPVSSVSTEKSSKKRKKKKK